MPVPTRRAGRGRVVDVASGLLLKLGLASGSNKALFFRSYHVGGISERGKEIKRRRHRRKKLNHFAKRLKKATASEKTSIAARSAT